MPYYINKKIEIVNDEFGISYTFSYADEYGTITLADDNDSVSRTVYITQSVLQHVVDVLTELKQSPKD